MLEIAPRKSSQWQRLVLNCFAILLLLLAVAIGLQVVLSYFNINPLLKFENSIVLFGDAITLNSLLDLQWHLLCAIALLPAAIVWLRDAHIRVDFLNARLSNRSQALVELIGHLLFSIPFLFMSVPAAWSFMWTAYRSNQGSNNDGLNNLFLVKAILPLGLALLALVVIYDLWIQIRRWSRA